MPIDNFRQFMRFETFEENNPLENNDSHICEELYDRLIDTTEKILEILKGKT